MKLTSGVDPSAERKAAKCARTHTVFAVIASKPVKTMTPADFLDRLDKPA